MFKRKEALPPTVGKYCALNNDVIERLKESDRYNEFSASKYAESVGGKIQKRWKEKRYNSKEVFLADCTLLFIEKKSIFAGLVVVKPMALKEDGMSAQGILGIAKHNLSYLVSLKSLSLVTESSAKNILDGTYWDNEINRIKDRIVKKTTTNAVELTFI